MPVHIKEDTLNTQRNVLISSIETIKKYIHNSEMVCQVFIDLLNTFDTVNHGVLLEKLKHYGIRGKPINLF